MVLGYEGREKIVDPVNFKTKTVQQWLQKVREKAHEKVNKTHDKEATWFDAKRSPAPVFKVGDLILEWRTVSGEGLTTKLVRPWIGPLEVFRQIGPVNYQV